jgi:Antirestriction protein
MKLLQRKPAPITREIIPEEKRLALIEKILGIPIRIEIVIQGIARRMTGGCELKSWVCLYLSNGGLYFLPTIDRMYSVVNDNGSGWRGNLSADALGLAASMLSYSHMSFTGRLEFDECCDNQYFFLKEYVNTHNEEAAIKQAIA